MNVFFFGQAAAETPPEGGWVEKIWWAFLRAVNFIISQGWTRFLVLGFLGVVIFHFLTRWFPRIVGLIVAIAAFGVLYFILFPYLSQTITGMLPKVEVPSFPKPTLPMPGEGGTNKPPFLPPAPPASGEESSNLGGGGSFAVLNAPPGIPPLGGEAGELPFAVAAPSYAIFRRGA